MRAANRLLIVDDDDVIVLGLLDYLKLHGHQVDTARDYDTAKLLINSKRYAVAVVELVVTGHGGDAGIGFLQWLRATSPETAVVVLTAYRTAWLERIALSLGVTLFFDKPKLFDEIVHLVSTLLSKPKSIPGETRV